MLRVFGNKNLIQPTPAFCCVVLVYWGSTWQGKLKSYVCNYFYPLFCSMDRLSREEAVVVGVVPEGVVLVEVT